MIVHSHGDQMYVTAGTALAALCLSFAVIMLLGKKFKQEIPIAVNLFVSTAISAIVTGFNPFRHLFEGPVWYIYINLVIMCGMMLLGCMKAAGNLDCIAYDTLTKFRKHPTMIFFIVMALLFFPGMVTGVGTAAILSTGMVAVVILRICGISNLTIAAIIAIETTLGASAPPVNLPAIIIASGINMPYEGFDRILWVLTAPTGIFTMFWLAWKEYKVPSLEAIEAALPKPERRFGFAPYLPLVVVVAIMICIRALPGRFPDIVTPMVFMVGSAVTLFTGKKFGYVRACRESLSGGVLSTVCLIFVVGSVVQVTTLTGAKGLLVLTAMTVGSKAPALMYAAIGLSVPLLGGVLTQMGTAAILGIPFTLAMISKNQVAFVAGIANLCVFAQMVPPTALGGYFSKDLTGIPAYLPLLKKCMVPILVCIGFTLIELVYADQFAKLFVPF